MLDRTANLRQRKEPDGEDARRLEIAGGGEFLAAGDILVGDARQVDRRPLSAMDLVDDAIVIVQRADADALAARQPFDLVADADGS